MLNQPQIARMLSKLKQLELSLDPYVFEKQDEVAMEGYETSELLYSAPENVEYKPFKAGDKWGGERRYCWFKGVYTVPERLEGQPLYVYPSCGGYEALLFVNGRAYGNFAYKISTTDHGNHYCDLFSLEPKANEKISLVLEAYAGHNFPGTQPFENFPDKDCIYPFEAVNVCTKNQDIADFIYDLRILNQLVEAMDTDSFRRADIINCLTKVHQTVYYSPEHVEMSVLRDSLKQAREIMRPILAAKNSASAPSVGLIGHSHMDTAWLWDISETIKKCARTYSNQLSFMDQYPEYKFIQSSAYHLELIRRHYPELFERIAQRIKEGRYEPNGAVWIECDCNITGGEAMIRQFLWGQKYTQKYFDYTSDCFWLPDTFGYSASIPQIMKGCGVNYFLTTKIGWNDTNLFPYETFKWQGIDNTDVLVHFNCTHAGPEPANLIGRTEGQGKDNAIQQKTVAKERLIAFGPGDGGGGPLFEMIEIARRLKDLEGCPKADYTTISSFMKKLEKNMVSPNVYSGELYLELHRATLTNQHDIKRNNRKAEIALRNAELLICANAVKSGEAASDKEIRPLLETLLVNQFHDILPGTCINSANIQSVNETTAVINDANAIIEKETSAKGDGISVINTLSFDNNDVLHLNTDGKFIKANLKQQLVKDIDDNCKLAVSGSSIPALSSLHFEFTEEHQAKKSPFSFNGDTLTTPFAKIRFNEKGYMKSFIDKRNGRQLVDGLPFNTLLIAEDVPSAWDNWDLDADCMLKFKDTATLVKEEVVSEGEVELRIRRTYNLTDKSTLMQDVIFYADTPRVDFETIIDWHDKRRFVKTAFDTSILTRQARHEIQFGYVQKPTTRNNSLEQAMFEVVNHKYTDLSETQYGIAILNDCKYGISTDGGKLWLSLQKSGIRPDDRGDAGRHKTVYSLLPHMGGFSAEAVVHPGYSLNYPPIEAKGEFNLPKLIELDASNVIIEAIKPCEDNEKAIIVRLYEAEGTFTKAALSIAMNSKSVEETNMLEEPIRKLGNGGKLSLSFKPFEIKTIKIAY